MLWSSISQARRGGWSVARCVTSCRLRHSISSHTYMAAPVERFSGSALKSCFSSSTSAATTDEKGGLRVFERHTKCVTVPTGGTAAGPLSTFSANNEAKEHLPLPVCGKMTAEIKSSTLCDCSLWVFINFSNALTEMPLFAGARSEIVRIKYLKSSQVIWAGILSSKESSSPGVRELYFATFPPLTMLIKFDFSRTGSLARKTR